MNFGWRIDELGNKSLERSGRTAKVYPHGSGFKFVILIGNTKVAHSHSKHFMSEAQAIASAEEKLRSLADEDWQNRSPY